MGTFLRQDAGWYGHYPPCFVLGTGRHGPTGNTYPTTVPSKGMTTASSDDWVVLQVLSREAFGDAVGGQCGVLAPL